MTNTDQTDALQPCPFCGRRTIGFRQCDADKLAGAIHQGPPRFEAICSSCFACSGPERTHTKAAANWNTRAPEPEGEPRYFVDERVGCVAVRDRVNTDPTYPGLHKDTEGVVWYKHGTQGEDAQGWGVAEVYREEARKVCAQFNAAVQKAAPTAQPEAVQSLCPTSSSESSSSLSSPALLTPPESQPTAGSGEGEAVATDLLPHEQCAEALLSAGVPLVMTIKTLDATAAFVLPFFQAATSAAEQAKAQAEQERDAAVRRDIRNATTCTGWKSRAAQAERRAQAAEADNKRLCDGQFTPQEFQNLCHNFTDVEPHVFCKGCEDYQQKLFGKSPITELRAERDAARAEVEALSKEIARLKENLSPKVSE